MTNNLTNKQNKPTVVGINFIINLIFLYIMNNMSMKEFCVAANEKCVCTRRSEANKILHVAEGENAQLVRIRTKDNVFIVWCYDGAEETLFYPAFKVDEGKLPDITGILAANIVKPQTAFFNYRTGEYYYLQAEAQEKEEDGYKWQEILDTEIMQIVVFANERIIWQIFNCMNYPEVPRKLFIRPYALDFGGEKKIFWYIQISSHEFMDTSDSLKIKYDQKEFSIWDSVKKFWKPNVSKMVPILSVDNYSVIKNFTDMHTYLDEDDAINDYLFKNHSNLLKKIIHEDSVFIPLVWSDNTSLSEDVLTNLMQQVKVAKELEMFGKSKREDRSKSGYLQAKQSNAFYYKRIYQTLKAEADDTYNITSTKAFRAGDSYYSCGWDDTLGMNFRKANKPRLFFLQDDSNAMDIAKFHSREISLNDSSEDVDFRSYLRWSDPEYVNRRMYDTDKKEHLQTK